MHAPHRVYIRLTLKQEDETSNLDLALNAALPPEALADQIALLRRAGVRLPPGLAEASVPASAPPRRPHRRPRGQPPPGKIRQSHFADRLNVTRDYVAVLLRRGRLDPALDADGWLDEAAATRILVRTSRPGTKINEAARAHAARLGLDLEEAATTAGDHL